MYIKTICSVAVSVLKKGHSMIRLEDTFAF